MCVCWHVYWHVCADMCAGMCADMCVSTNVLEGMSNGDVYVDEAVDAYVDMCVDMCVDRQLQRLLFAIAKKKDELGVCGCVRRHRVGTFRAEAAVFVRTGHSSIPVSMHAAVGDADVKKKETSLKKSQNHALLQGGVDLAMARKLWPM